MPNRNPALLVTATEPLVVRGVAWETIYIEPHMPEVWSENETLHISPASYWGGVQNEVITYVHLAIAVTHACNYVVRRGTAPVKRLSPPDD